MAMVEQKLPSMSCPVSAPRLRRTALEGGICIDSDDDQAITEEEKAQIARAFGVDGEEGGVSGRAARLLTKLQVSTYI